MTYKLIALDKKDGLATLTLNQPDKLNAVSRKMIAEIKSAWEDIAADGSVRAVLLTGAGRGFCAGADLSDPDRANDADSGSALEKFFNPVIRTMRSVPKPIVAAVNGVAAGVGVSLALACDLCVAAESAYFLLAFRRIGLVPDGGATWLLPRLVGKARAMELMLLGEKLPAATACEWGLINRCVADDKLMETALGFAKALATGPKSLGMTRNLVWEALDAPWHLQLEAEAYAQGDAGRTEDAHEGIMAFVQKRPAEFKGR